MILSLGGQDVKVRYQPVEQHADRREVMASPSASRSADIGSFRDYGWVVSSR